MFSAVPISFASARSRSPVLLSCSPRLRLRLANPRSRSSEPLNVCRIRLGVPPPSGLDLLASRHGTSGCQDQSLTETCRPWANKQSSRSLNNVVSAEEQQLRNREAQGLRRLEIDDQLESRRLLHGQVGGVGGFSDLFHE